MPVECLSKFYEELWDDRNVPESVREELNEKLVGDVSSICLCDECVKKRQEEESG